MAKSFEVKHYISRLPGYWGGNRVKIFFASFVCGGVILLLFLFLFLMMGEPAENPRLAEAEFLTASDPVSIIESSVEDVLGTDGYSVTVWTLDENLASKDSQPPFEVIVNVGAGKFQDCFDAKHKMFSVMKTLYTNDRLEGKIIRVKLSAWGQLKASLGSADIGFDWDAAGFTNFWKVLQQYNPYEDESGLLNQRTYGVRINSSCQ